MSLEIIRAGQQILNQIDPNVGRVVNQLGDFLNPRKEPQRSYMWEVEFSDPNGSTGSLVKYYAKATGIPSTMNETVKRRYAGVEYAYPGRDTSPRIFRVTFWDNQELTVYKFFEQWINLTQSGLERTKANPINYTRNIKLTLKDQSDLLPNQVFQMNGAFPTEISEASLTYTESGELTFDVMFYFDRKITL